MFGTTAAKLGASVLVVAAAASGTARDRLMASTHPHMAESQLPVVLDRNSLLVATLANGELQTQWMSRQACERVASAVATGGSVAGVRQDGVKIYITRANCSTRRIEAAPDTVALSSFAPRN
ncbi:MAG: hypothetical protein JSR99_13870 [Proteobacteria bacterium]|nr:hypothetical protein [Pseudomonadota bacterium]